MRASSRTRSRTQRSEAGPTATIRRIAATARTAALTRPTSSASKSCPGRHAPSRAVTRRHAPSRAVTRRHAPSRAVTRRHAPSRAGAPAGGAAVCQAAGGRVGGAGGGAGGGGHEGLPVGGRGRQREAPGSEQGR